MAYEPWRKRVDVELAIVTVSIEIRVQHPVFQRGH